MGQLENLREKCPTVEYLSVFSPNAGKYGPEKTAYLDTFHAVLSLSVNLIGLYLWHHSEFIYYIVDMHSFHLATSK